MQSGELQSCSLISVLGEVMEQVVLIATMQYVQDNQVFRHSQHGFRKGRSCFTKLIPFYDKVTCLVHEGKAVAVLNLDFSPGLCFTEHSSEETDFPWCGLVNSWLGKKKG